MLHRRPTLIPVTRQRHGLFGDRNCVVNRIFFDCFSGNRIDVLVYGFLQGHYLLAISRFQAWRGVALRGCCQSVVGSRSRRPPETRGRQCTA